MISSAKNRKATLNFQKYFKSNFGKDTLKVILVTFTKSPGFIISKVTKHQNLPKKLAIFSRGLVEFETFELGRIYFVVSSLKKYEKN